MSFAVNEIDKSHGRPKKYRKEIPQKVEREVGSWEDALKFGTSSAIKKISVEYPKFIRTSVNNWKSKCKTRGDNFVFKKVGRRNLLDNNLIKKVRDIAIGTLQGGGVINRRQL